MNYVAGDVAIELLRRGTHLQLFPGIIAFRNAGALKAIFVVFRAGSIWKIVFGSQFVYPVFCWPAGLTVRTWFEARFDIRC